MSGSSATGLMDQQQALWHHCAPNSPCAVSARLTVQADDEDFDLPPIKDSSAHHLNKLSILFFTTISIYKNLIYIMELSMWVTWNYHVMLFSPLQCFDTGVTLLVGQQDGHPACKKTERWGAGVVICLQWGADLHMAQLMPLPLTASCFSKIQIGFTFLVPAHLGSLGNHTHTHRHTHTHTRLTALFPGLPGWAGTRKVKPIWILLKQETC